MSDMPDIDRLLKIVPDLDPEPVKDQAPPGRLRVPPSKGKFTGPTWEELTPTLEAIVAAGAPAVAGLVARLKEVDDGTDYRARYLLHVLAIWLGHPDRAAARQAFEAALLREAEGEHPKGVRRFLLQQLRICGTRRSIAVLGRALADADLGEDAAAALEAIGEGAAAVFRAALPKLAGKARLSAVQALGVLKDRDAIPLLRAAAGDASDDVRLAATWGLANIGDPGSEKLVLGALAGKGWMRIQAFKACLVLAENLAADGRTRIARRVYGGVIAACADPGEKYICDAADGALRALPRRSWLGDLFR